MSCQATTLRPADVIPSFDYAPLCWLAIGTFAVGTEGFMVAAILPDIGRDLAVSVPAAGQLITIFALTYAFSSPLLTALTANLDRRKLLIASMAAFAAANVIAATASSFWFLAGARVLLAMAAGLYVPNATSLAGAIVPPERRGRALAIVTGGISIAVALGVPLGALTGAHFGWRMTFVGVAIMAAIALLGLLVGLERGIGSGLPIAVLRERVAQVRRPAALVGLLVTTLWATGGFAVYTYVATFLATVTGLEGARVGYALFAWGAAAFVGLLAGGLTSDRIGSRRVIAVVLPLFATALGTLSVSAHYLTPSQALAPVLIALMVWGTAGWGFFPAQQARLIAITGLKGAPIILSLNASFQYLGFALGAVLGSVVLTHAGLGDLGFAGATCVLAALALSELTDRFGRSNSGNGS